MLAITGEASSSLRHQGSYYLCPLRLGSSGLFCLLQRAILAGVEYTGTLRGLLIGRSDVSRSDAPYPLVADALEGQSHTRGARLGCDSRPVISRLATERRDPLFVDG